MKQRILFPAMAAMIILSAAIFFTACNKNDDNNTNTPAAGIMAFNLAPDGRTVSFLASDRFITSSPLVFNSYTGGYIGILPGMQTIGAVNFNGGGTLASASYNFEADKYYSAFLVGLDPNYEAIIVKDDFDSLSTTTKAFARYVNAIPDASNPQVTVSVNGTDVINESAAFKTVSAFTALDPGSVTITVSNGGTINVTRTITLEAKKVYTILLAGKPGDSGATAVQIKYIQNGSVDASSGKIAGGSGVSLN